MAAHAGQQMPARKVEMGLAFLFGCVALAAVLGLAFRGEDLNDRQFEILRIVLALAGGGVGAVVPGFLELNVKAGTTLALRAGGALAVFVVLYFWSPAHWAPPSPGPVVQRTGGIGSPALNGTGNSVVVNRAPPR